MSNHVLLCRNRMVTQSGEKYKVFPTSMTASLLPISPPRIIPRQNAAGRPLQLKKPQDLSLKCYTTTTTLQHSCCLVSFLQDSCILCLKLYPNKKGPLRMQRARLIELRVFCAMIYLTALLETVVYWAVSLPPFLAA